MNVNLGETFDRFIAKLLEGGLYQSQSEVVREGLRLLKEREDLRTYRLSQLRTELDKGLKDLENGDFETHDEKSLRTAFEASKARGREKLVSKKVRAE
jgi:antitoxin ParD1/3/4